MWVSQLELIKTTPSGVRGLIGKLAVNELSKVNPTAHTTQSVDLRLVDKPKIQQSLR